MRRITPTTSPASFICFLALATILIAIASNGLAQSDLSPFDRQIDRIRSEPLPSARAGYAYDLAQISKRLSEEGQAQDISDAVIDDIADLLQDENDGVRFYIATALGFLGSRSVRAVPALETALAKIEEQRRLRKIPAILGQDSGHAIELALEEITGGKN